MRRPCTRAGSRSTRPSDAARALEPLAGSAASDLFAIGFVGAAVLAIAIVPLSTAYSFAESRGAPADLDLGFGEARSFYLAYGAILAGAALLVLSPGCRSSRCSTSARR